MKTKRHILETFAGVLMLGMVIILVLLRSGTASGYPASATPTLGVPQGGNYHLSLPLIQKSGLDQFIKTKTGIHLGSGVYQNWSQGWQAQTRLTGGDSTQGIYPAIIVVLSRDVFNVARSGTSPCNITPISSVRNTALFDYLTAAANAGTKIVIRIYPSPGNFANAFGYGSHTLFIGLGLRPLHQFNGNWVVADYCTTGSGAVPGGGENFFRSFDDIANEMIAIRNYTSSQRGWTPFAFIPANEPNSEWYPGATYQFALQQNGDAWQNMDYYLDAVYSLIHPSPGTNSNIRVLAAPMGQSDYAEVKNIVDCTVYPGPPGGGLSYMTHTWMGSSIDGWSWNSYWTYQNEAASADNSCIAGDEHNFDAFPPTLQTQILARTKPALISEADLLSPQCQGSQPNLPNKGELYANQNGASAAYSIKQFISQEPGASYVAVWNLTDAYSDAQVCNASTDVNDEYAWHEAYRNTPPYERYWFYMWWMDTTQP